MSFFCCLGGGAGPAQTAKKNTRPRPNSKKKTKTDPPLPSVLFFLLFGRVGVLLFFCLGGDVFFCCLGRGRVFFFCCLGGVVFFFAVWAGDVLFILLFGRGSCLFFAVWAGDGSSLTYRSAWLVFKRPNNKKDQTAKKKSAGSSL